MKSEQILKQLKIIAKDYRERYDALKEIAEEYEKTSFPGESRMAASCLGRARGNLDCLMDLNDLIYVIESEESFGR